MQKFMTLTTILGLTVAVGCQKPKEPDYSVTTDVVRRSAPPPILINPIETNVDGMTGFQIGAADFLESADKEALVRSVTSHCTIARDKTGNTAVRIGNGKHITDTDVVKQLKKALTDLGFTVTVIERAKE